MKHLIETSQKEIIAIEEQAQIESDEFID